MDILNIIVSEKETGVIISINSFPVYEQLKDEVITQGVNHFIKKVIDYGHSKIDALEGIEDGYEETSDHMISFVWS